MPDSPMDAGFEVVESDFDVPPTEEMVSLYHSLIGSIGYVTNTVSFDVRYGLSVLSRFLAKPNDRKTVFADVIFGVVDVSFTMDPICDTELR